MIKCTKNAPSASLIQTSTIFTKKSQQQEQEQEQEQLLNF